ncbi:hypothetical protein K503DRAFT_791466 [Rhizopogon vinicolor AM-OR11-026]|uniref:Uncharacterized protein n=1 Tax=Rhizopogon vinicolor AM-OR11-026 TaxID=1314800 RepID=A0A1B7N661_9AGAM|nr:hypothetical protein K503DRAFT_791466 [Rhizopogon vinicolor AM-OR11-026]
MALSPLCIPIDELTRSLGFLLPSIHSAPPVFTRLFVLLVEDAEILRNKRINRQVPPSCISSLMAEMVAKNIAVYEPPKQIRAVMLYWRLPEECPDETVTGQLNTILTFYEISDPLIPSPLSGILIPFLQRAIMTLTRSNRAQIIGVADSEDVRFFAATK